MQYNQVWEEYLFGGETQPTITMLLRLFVVMNFGSLYSIVGGSEINLSTMRVFQIDRDNFTVNTTLSLAGMGSVACGAKLVSLKRREPLSDVNGFHFNVNTSLCEIGRFSQPFGGVGPDGITVFGLGKNRFISFTQ